MGVRHIHAVLYPFFVFPAVKLAPLLLGPGIMACCGLPNVLKFPCRRTSRVARLCCRYLGSTFIKVSGDLLVLGTFLFQGYVQSKQNLVVFGTLLVPLAGILVVCVQVYHIVNEGAAVEG